MPVFQSVLPDGVTVSYEFDESPTVIEAIRSVGIEGLIGAVLTGLMILLFLHDWRGVIVVVFNHHDDADNRHGEARPETPRRRSAHPSRRRNPRPMAPHRSAPGAASRRLSLGRRPSRCRCTHNPQAEGNTSDPLFAIGPVLPPALGFGSLPSHTAPGGGLRPKTKPAPAVDVEPQVRLIKPETRNIAHTIGQPGFIYAHEQTAIFPKVAGFLEKWNVDIGDPIKKGQELALLDVPELVAELEQKKSQAEMDETQIKVAQKLVKVATQNELAAGRQVKEAQATVGRYQASVEQWQSQVKELTPLANGGDGGTVSKQTLNVAKMQLKSETAARTAAESSVTSSQANQLARKADIAKAQADVEAARAKAKVGKADERRTSPPYSPIRTSSLLTMARS